MIRFCHVYFPGRMLALAVSELILTVLAAVVATFAQSGSDATLALTYDSGLFKILLATGVCMLCMHYYDLYDSIVLHSASQMAPRIIQVLGTVCVVLTLLYYVYPQAQLNRGLLVIWVFLAGTSLIAWRGIFLTFNRSGRLSQKA